MKKGISRRYFYLALPEASVTRVVPYIGNLKFADEFQKLSRDAQVGRLYCLAWQF